MFSKWPLSLIGLGIILCLAAVSAFYHSPNQVFYGMLQAMSGQAEWGWHAEGVVRGAPLQMDFVNHTGKALARISYAPLKIINNQWIELHNSPPPPLTLRGGVNSIPPLKIRGGAGGVMSPDFFLDAKWLFPIKHKGRWYDRYLFTTPTAVLSLVPDLTSIVGEMWFPLKAQWPWQNLARLPAYGILNFNLAQTPLILTFTNYTTFNDAMFAPARKLADVLDQLEKIKNTQNNKPQTLIPLAVGVGADPSFTSDFDKDGLSDALEIFYGADPANPDTDNDKFLDGEEVRRGYNPRGDGKKISNSPNF